MLDERSSRFMSGNGRPLVFLHGWLGSKESWTQVRQHLNLDNPMLFYDQRCHGDAPCEQFDFDDLAGDLHALVGEHGLEEPVLVGHSMGGMVALTYAVNYDNLGGLLLLGTCASTPEPDVEDPQFYLDNVHSMDREEWAGMIADNYIGKDDGVLRRETVRELLAADDIPVVSGLKAMIDYDVRNDLSDVNTPAAVVGATRDGAITREKVEELAELLDAPLTMLDSSHLMLQEVPEKVAERVEAFAETVADQSA